MQGELNNIRDEIMKFKVGAPARVGLVAPNDVEVPAGGTGLDPSSTNFFQVCHHWSKAQLFRQCPCGHFAQSFWLHLVMINLQAISHP